LETRAAPVSVEPADVTPDWARDKEPTPPARVQLTEEESIEGLSQSSDQYRWLGPEGNVQQVAASAAAQPSTTRDSARVRLDEPVAKQPEPGLIAKLRRVVSRSAGTPESPFRGGR
jgi:hypothetical protein